MKSHKRPNFFIVGAPKCGTTALNYYLGTHPDIFVSKKKEMHFFGSDLQFGPQLQFYRRYPQEYMAEFEAWNDQTYGGEASVWYLFSEQAATEIKAFSPDARIIIMLRKPTAMMHALHSAFLADGNEFLPTFKEALAAEEDRRAGRRLSRTTYLAQALVYRATARFSEQVKRYFDVFGRERVHVIIYDDFCVQTADVFGKTLDFLGVARGGGSTEFQVINGNANGNSSVRSPALRAFLNDRSMRGVAVALHNWLPHGVFTAMRNTWVKLNNFNFIDSPKKRSPMEPELQQSLIREFEPEVERLSRLLGRDLTHWSKPEPIPRPEAGASTVEMQQAISNQARRTAT